jgi:hypothetical protein
MWALHHPATALNDKAQVLYNHARSYIVHFSSQLPPTAYDTPIWALDLAGQHAMLNA